MRAWRWERRREQFDRRDFACAQPVLGGGAGENSLIVEICACAQPAGGGKQENGERGDAYERRNVDICDLGGARRSVHRPGDLCGAQQKRKGVRFLGECEGCARDRYKKV